VNVNTLLLLFYAEPCYWYPVAAATGTEAAFQLQRGLHVLIVTATVTAKLQYEYPSSNYPRYGHLE